MATRREASTWTWRERLALGFAVAFLGFQIGVPAWQLTAPRPARFGWHMWAARRQFPRFTLTMRDGTTRPADLATFVGLSRGEMDLSEALPPHLCRHVAGVAAVEVSATETTTAKVYACP